MLTANPQTVEAAHPRPAPPGRAHHRAARGIVATLTLLGALVVPAYAISTGHATWAERLVPRQQVLRLSDWLGTAPPRTIVLLFVGVFAFLVAVWALVCAATYTMGSLVDRARHR